MNVTFNTSCIDQMCISSFILCKHSYFAFICKHPLWTSHICFHEVVPKNTYNSKGADKNLMSMTTTTTCFSFASRLLFIFAWNIPLYGDCSKFVLVWTENYLTFSVGAKNDSWNFHENFGTAHSNCQALQYSHWSLFNFSCIFLICITCLQRQTAVVAQFDEYE